jgi:sugar phosphate permease
MARTSAQARPAGQAGSQPREPGGQRGPAGRGQWQVLAVVLVGSFMAVLDTTIVNVALPSIALGTQAQSAALEWVVSGYALAFGLTLVPAGRLGDRFGYRAIFLSGLTLFTLASLGCGLGLPRTLGAERAEENG